MIYGKLRAASGPAQHGGSDLQRLPPFRALDPSPELHDGSAMKSGSVKVVGHLRKTPWQRFARLQRTAAQLARGRGQPKGVFRFSSNEACDAWTASLNRNAR
jgi:hypothetical protein